MYEVEVKLPADHGAVRDRLRAVGAAYRATVEQADTYYDAPHRSFAETDEALRIRRERVVDAADDPDADGAAHLTYKGPLVDADSKSREEVETGVADGDDAAAILAALDFTPVETVEKRRERWRLDGYTVTLDEVDGVGEFVEVETEAEAVAPAREGVVDVLARLDLDPDEQVRDSYLAMLLD